MGHRPLYLFFKIPAFLTRLICLLLCFFIFFEQSGFCQVVDISPYMEERFLAPLVAGPRPDHKFRPVHLRYMSYDDAANHFKLIMDRGDLERARLSGVENDSKKLFHFFLSGISLPDEDFWVNLNPNEPDRIMELSLSQTEIGRIMIEADLQLKKEMSSATSPKSPEGKDFWDALDKKAGELFSEGRGQVPVFSLSTRCWIVPDEIIMRGTPNDAYIYKAVLKVMLEEDHAGPKKTTRVSDPRLKEFQEYATGLMRERILPRLTRSVNVSRQYASLRQVYYSLILAHWFKTYFRGRGGLYSWMIDRAQFFDQDRRWSVDSYFKEYLKSIKQGEYDISYAEESFFGAVTRRYFSGGVILNGAVLVDALRKGAINAAAYPAAAFAKEMQKAEYLVSVDIKGAKAFNRPTDFNIENMDFVDTSSPVTGAAPVAVASSPARAGQHADKKAGSFFLFTFFASFFASLLTPLSAMAHEFVQKGGQLFVNIARWSPSHPSENTLWGVSRDILRVKLDASPSHTEVARAISEIAKLNKLDNPDLIHPVSYNVNIEGLSQQVIDHLTHSVPQVSQNEGLSQQVIDHLTHSVPQAVQNTAAPVVQAPPDGLMEFLSGSWLSIGTWAQQNVLCLVAGGVAVLGIVLAKVIYSKWKEKRQVLPGLELPASNGNGSVSGICGKAEVLLEDWRQTLEKEGPLNETDCLNMTNHAKRIINLTHFSVPLVWPNMRGLAGVYRRMFAVAAYAAAAMVKTLDENPDMDPVKKRQFLFYAQEFRMIAAYSLEYNSTLNYLKNLEIMGGYFLPIDEKNQREIFAPIPDGVRRIFGMRREISISKEYFDMHLHEVSRIGNKIEPHLYQKEEIKKSWEKHLATLLSLRRDILLGVERAWLIRKVMFSRLLPLVLAFRPFAQVGWAWLIGTPLVMTVSAFLQSFLISLGFGVALSVAISWISLIRGSRDKFYDSNSDIILELDRRINVWGQQRNPAREDQDSLVSEDERGDILLVEYEKTLLAYQEETSPLFEASADLVLVLTGHGRTQEQEDVLRKSITPIVREGIPTAFVLSPGEGSGYAFIELFHFFGSDAFKKLQESYPRLNRPLKELRILVVMVSRSDAGKIFHPLPSAAVLPLTTTAFAVMNGYKATRGLMQAGRAGMVLVNGEGIYVGPLDRVDDINLIGAWSSSEQITQQALGLFLINHGNRITKFYEKFDIEKIRGKLERQSLLASFDFSNKKKRQFTAFTGNMIFSFGSDEKRRELFRLMEMIRDYLAKAGFRQPMNLSSDILVPLIMKSCEENIYTYLARHIQQQDDDVRTFYFKLFDLYSMYPSHFNFFTADSYHHGGFYTRSDASPYDKELREMMSLWQKHGPPSSVTPWTSSSPVTGLIAEQVLATVLDYFEIPHPMFFLNVVKQMGLVLKEDNRAKHGYAVVALSILAEASERLKKGERFSGALKDQLVLLAMDARPDIYGKVVATDALGMLACEAGNNNYGVSLFRAAHGTYSVMLENLGYLEKERWKKVRRLIVARLRDIKDDALSGDGKSKTPVVRDAVRPVMGGKDSERPASSPIAHAFDPGGIDFTSLEPTSVVLSSAAPDHEVPIQASFAMVTEQALRRDEDQINGMMRSGLIPPTHKLREYFSKCVEKNCVRQKMGVMYLWIAGVLRKEEEYVLASDKELKDILADVEAYS
jgi:hypothetical protein